MTTLVVTPTNAPLRGVVAAPPGPTMLQIGLLAAALGPPGATTRIEGRGVPALPLTAALRPLGVTVERDAAVGLTVFGVGLDGLLGPPRSASGAPREPLVVPCPPDPVVMGALLGAVAGRSTPLRLDGDPEAIALHAAGAARALRLRGAQLEGTLDPNRVGVLSPPLDVGPAPGPLSELQLDATRRPAPAAKAAALMSGLLALGDTFVHERTVSDDRLERVLAAVGVPLENVGPMLRLIPPAGPLSPLSGPPPGDPSFAAAMFAASAHHDAAHVGVRGVGLAPSRNGWFEALRDTGVRLHHHGGGERWGMAVGDLHLDGAPPGPLRVAGERGLRVGIPLPLLAALAARAPGESELTDVPLDHPRQLPATFRLLQTIGVPARPIERGLAVRGGAPPQGGVKVDAAGDPALAMGATVLAVGARAPCRIVGAEVIGLSFPRFVGYLRALGADIEVQASTPSPGGT
ncbi:MAG: hypothetical protein AAGN82_08805 [Myxococcota bacterium]